MEIEKEQMQTFNQESFSDDKSLKYKVYNYFYLIVNSKKHLNAILLSFFIILETIQLILEIG